MFTGIIQAIGTIRRIEPQQGDYRLAIHSGTLPWAAVVIGDSIAVSGVCLTVVERVAEGFAADVSRETLSRTTLGHLRSGDAVNLELALTPASRLGGHIVSGHVDGVGRILDRCGDARSVRFRIENPPQLSRYIAEKGSICVDGISLTVNDVGTAWFEVNIVPHTLRETTLGSTDIGRPVNLEVDLLARYLERLMLGARENGDASVTAELLRNTGFIDNDHEHD